MASIFTKILQGKIPCYQIAETADYFAFLDIMPLAKGHVLCIPKKEVDYIFDMEDDLLAGLHVFTKKIAKAVHKAIPCTRVGMSVIGLEVPHTHIHLIPLNSMDDINFTRPKMNLEPEEMESIAERIRMELKE